MDAPTRKRTREIVFVERDEAIFSLALKDEFPDIELFDDDTRGGRIPCASVSSSRGAIVTAFPAGRIPEAEPNAASSTAMIDHRWLDIWRYDWLWGYAGVPSSRWAWDPPTLRSGRISSSHKADDAVARRFVDRVWRMIGRIATNRVKCGDDRVNDLNMGNRHVWMRDAEAGMMWCGHQALAWCRAGNERRMLDGHARPCDDWDVPSDPWYQDLVRRASETEAWHAQTLRSVRP